MIVYTCHLPADEVLGGLCEEFRAGKDGIGHFIKIRAVGEERLREKRIGRWVFRSGETVLLDRDLDALNPQKEAHL